MVYQFCLTFVFCALAVFSIGCSGSRKLVTTHEWNQSPTVAIANRTIHKTSQSFPETGSREESAISQLVLRPKLQREEISISRGSSLVSFGSNEMFRQSNAISGHANDEQIVAQSVSVNQNRFSNSSIRQTSNTEIPTHGLEQVQGEVFVTKDISYSPSGSSFSIPASPNTIQLNLPTALSMVGGKHPAVGLARWRVQEAYAKLDQARVLWLPSIQPGFSFHKHDGNYQASNGAISDVNRNSFQYGLGAGATGAGTTPRQGIVAQFHLADAIFQPEIALKTAWAEGHNANAIQNKQLFEVSMAYLHLLKAEQQSRIVQETHQRITELAKLTDDFAVTGQGLQADADRMQTELRLVESRLVRAQEDIDVASSKLAYALSIDAGKQIVPLDPTVIPLELVSLDSDKSSLIRTGLTNRPELKEAQALVSVACEQYKRQKYAAFVPSVLLGYSMGEFGGGLGNRLGDIDNRYDFDAVITWEIRNLGFGEKSSRRQTEARYQQAKYEKLKVLDQVAKEIAEAHSKAVHRAGRIDLTQRAIESAENSYHRNLSRIRDGQGIPLEVLQSVRALDEAQQAYLNAIVEHNEAQFRLQWALGWTVSATQ